MSYILELKNVSKQFPGVLANDSVNLTVEEGKVHAIVGENGAGKSTLMNIIYGLFKPSQGEIFFRGKKVEFSSSLDAIDCGIGMVHQHFMLLPSFKVWENIMLGLEPKKGRFFIDKARGLKETRALSREYGLSVDPEARVQSLSVGIQQRVEILKALYRGADLLILDEPTAVLTPQETDELFKVIRRLSSQGKTVIIITHKLGEVMAISDRVSVMRGGRMVGTVETSRVDERGLAEMMVGRPLILRDLERGQPKDSKVLLSLRGLEAKNNLGLPALRGINLDLRAGEILGLAGIEGNGQSQLVEIICGLSKPSQGQVIINSRLQESIDPLEARRSGLAHVPEDRLSRGLSSQASLWENLLMGSQRKKEFMGPLAYLKKSRARERARDLIKAYDIRTPSEDNLVGQLSGGNMQKLLIAREFSFKTPILIISQPTRGVDIGAIEFIHKEIIKKRDEGVAILLVSAELDEIFRLSDRIVSIYEGRITGEFRPDEISPRELGLYMTGKTRTGDRDETN